MLTGPEGQGTGPWLSANAPPWCVELPGNPPVFFPEVTLGSSQIWNKKLGKLGQLKHRSRYVEVYKNETREWNAMDLVEWRFLYYILLYNIS